MLFTCCRFSLMVNAIFFCIYKQNLKKSRFFFSNIFCFNFKNNLCICIYVRLANRIKFNHSSFEYDNKHLIRHKMQQKINTSYLDSELTELKMTTCQLYYNNMTEKHFWLFPQNETSQLT